MTQAPPANPITLGHFRASTGYTAADTQINVTLRPKGDTPQDFPATMIAYDRAVGILDLIVDLPEGVSIMHSSDTAPVDKPVKFIFEEDDNGEPTTNQIACAVQAEPADVAHLLAQPVGLDGRSAWTWLRLKDGTLMLVTYPSGDTYVELSDKGVCDWVWQGESAQAVEPVRPRKVWSSGWNVPGYLPDDEPMNLDTWSAARDALMEELERARDEATDDGVADDNNPYIDAIDDLSDAEDGINWCQRVGNYVWWVQEIVLPEGDEPDHG